MDIKISGVSNVLKQLDALVDTIRPQAAIVTRELVQELKDNTPVDTGAARDAWEIHETPRGLSIENSKDYIEQLNAGSSKQAPSFFVEKTLLSKRGVRANGTIVKYE